MGYLRIALEDQPHVSIHPHFEEGIQFIKEGIADKGVLVHCMCGVSRSVTMILAYLIKERNMPLGEAYAHVKKCRTVACPNLGFVNQLGAYEEKLTGKNTKQEVYNIDW